MEQSYTTVNYGSSNSKRALPQPRALSGISHLVCPGGGEFVRKPLPGGGAFVKSYRSD